MVITVPDGMVSVPLPPMVPLPQFIAAPVRLIAAVPLIVPLIIVSVGSDCVAALLSVSVPPLIVVGAESVPANVLVPPCHTTLPGPLIVVAASNVRVSPVLKFNAAPELALNVAPVLVTAAR